MFASHLTTRKHNFSVGIFFFFFNVWYVFVGFDVTNQLKALIVIAAAAVEEQPPYPNRKSYEMKMRNKILLFVLCFFSRFYFCKLIAFGNINLMVVVVVLVLFFLVICYYYCCCSGGKKDDLKHTTQHERLLVCYSYLIFVCFYYWFKKKQTHIASSI